MLSPQFFDIFRLLGFVYITIAAAFLLKSRTLPKWFLVVLLLIGLVGLIVDGYIVFHLL